MVMFGNGAKTGMEITAAVHRSILRDRHLALAAFFVAAAGAAMQGAAGCLIVSTTTLAMGLATSASALSFRNYNYNPSFCTKL